jgi:hypothetical protein
MNTVLDEPIAVFETDPQLGTPKVKPLRGVALNWGETELSALEEQLRSRYECLVRDGQGTARFKSLTLFIKKKADDTSRQPTLGLWQMTQPAPPLEEKAAVFMKPIAPSLDWGECFLGEIDRLLGSERFNAVLPAEKAMLQLVRDELKGILEKTASPERALVVLVSMLMTAEHLSRTQRPNEPHPYAYALSGIERLLNGTAPPTPWGKLPTTPNSAPAPSWIGRLWARVMGA